MVVVVVIVLGLVVLVLADEMYPTVVVTVGPKGCTSIPILLPTSSVKKTAIFP